VNGLFIRVDVAEDARADAELATRLEEACPVDIYAATAGGVEIVEENLDECVLCGLCLDASPPGAVRVVKLYDGEALERRPQRGRPGAAGGPGGREPPGSASA
jgi:NAD-dependent dihydropyrimidine dehydrogenase PreA subunit